MATSTLPRRTYLDYNASAPLMVAARQAMLHALELTGNPSSVHGDGRRLRGIIEAARDDVAALVGARPADVVFSSGATEANVTAVGGFDTVFCAGVEHDSVLAPVGASGARVITLPVDRDGVVETGAIAEAVLLAGAPLGRALIALQLANNETGVIQPVADVAAFAQAHGVAVHCDGVQAAGRLLVDVAALGVDTFSLSAHKIGGPAGIGALIVREGSNVAPLLRGGGQERRRRAGTENTAAIAGFGAAAREARRAASDCARIAALRDRLEAGVLHATPTAVVFGRGAARLPNTSCFAQPGGASEILLIKLDVAGFSVSAGSACSSGKVGASHVLAAMGVPQDLSRGAVRVSLGTTTTTAEVDAFVAAWASCHGKSASANGPVSGMPERVWPGVPGPSIGEVRYGRR